MTRSGGILLTALALLIGVGGGAGLFTFVYGQGGSYLTNDPAACANCHVMEDHLSAWTSSSHRSVAVCNDCHAPHDLLAKWVTKGINGWNHSVAFTTGSYPEHLIMTDYNRRVTEEACRYCHTSLSEAVDGPAHEDEPRACLTCHSDVGHRSGSPLRSSRIARAPTPTAPLSTVTNHD